MTGSDQGVGGALRLCFSLKRPVPRGAYAATGFALMALKYLTDAGAIYLATGELWTPIDYLSPRLMTVCP